MLNLGHFTKEDLDSYVTFSNYINPLVTLLYICHRCLDKRWAYHPWENSEHTVHELATYYITTEPDAQRLAADYYIPPQFVPLPTAKVKLL